MLASGLNPIFQQGKSRGAGAVPYRSMVTPEGKMQLLAGIPQVRWEKNPATGS